MHWAVGELRCTNRTRTTLRQPASGAFPSQRFRVIYQSILTTVGKSYVFHFHMLPCFSDTPPPHLECPLHRRRSQWARPRHIYVRPQRQERHRPPATDRAHPDRPATGLETRCGLGYNCQYAAHACYQRHGKGSFHPLGLR